MPADEARLTAVRAACEHEGMNTSRDEGRSRAFGLFGCLLCLLPFVCSEAAQAGGFSITILGGRRTGMLATLGSPDDVTALFHNPAGLGELPGTRFHFSGSTTFFTTEFRLRPLDPVRFPAINPAGCGTPGQAACPWPVNSQGFYEKVIEPESYFGVLPYLGFSQDLGFISPKAKDVVVSFAVTAPNLYGANLPAGAPTAYNFIKGYFAVISAMAGAGWKINDKISVGAGLSYNYMRLSYAQRLSLADTLRGRNPTADDIIDADVAQAAIGDVRLDYTGVDHGMGWNFGVLLHPTSWLNFGISYNGATSANFKGAVSINEVAPPGGRLQELTRSIGIKLPTSLAVEMPIPHALGAGLTFKVSPKLEIGLDYRLWFYQVYNEQVIVPSYDPGQAGREPLSREDLSRRKDYNLSYEISLGFLTRPFANLPGLELMAGVGYDESPIPSRYLSLDNPALNQINLAVGARWQINPRWRLSGTYMANWFLERDVTNSALSPAMNLRGKGFSHIPRVEIEYMR